MKNNLSVLVGFAMLALAFPAGVQAQAPDLTTTALGTIDRTLTYNLGPTGMRGWIYRDGNNVGDFGTMSGQQPWQILVTAVGTATPASGIMAYDDVILGVSAGAGNLPVPNFTNDSRKCLGWAIGAAEAGDGRLNIKRWRAGVTTDVTLQMGMSNTAYSATAPFDCPKSALILTRAINIISNRTISGSPGGPVMALALLATGNTNFSAKLKTYALSISPGTGSLNPNACDTWGWGYKNVFLSEYYLSTNNTTVLNGIKEYTVNLAKAQSLYGTFGHGGAEQHADGSLHGSISWYGPVNSAGLVGNLGIAMGKKCIVASGGAVDAEIDPALDRASKFFGYYVGKGSIPYGEHEPWSGGHASNGKDNMAAFMFAMQGNRPVETEYYTRMTVAGYNGREYGHTGQGFSYLWSALAANIGGTNALVSYLAQVRWHLDLSRRSDGSFVYDGSEQYGGSENITDYWSDASDYAGIDPTASYVLTFSLPKQKLLLTGRNANPTNWLSSAVVSNAIWVGTFNLVCAGFTTNQLVAAMGEYDPGVRWWAAATIGARAGVSLTMLTNMANSTNVLLREAACQALGVQRNTAALPVLGQRLTDTNNWVRAKASQALQNYGSSASSQLTTMLMAFTNNATDPKVIIWDDPIQIANGYLADELFNTLGSSTINANTNLLYPALRAGLRQPDGMALGYLENFVGNRLSLTQVQAVAPELIAAIAVRSPADRMFSDEFRFTGANTLGKYKIEEGIPLSLMLKEQTWHSDDLRSLDNLINNYRGAAKDALPTLYAWQAHSNQFAADPSINACCPGRFTTLMSRIASTIYAITNDPSPPTLVYFKQLAAVSANPPAISLPTTNTLLSASVTDRDGGVARFTWSKVSGPGNVTFTPNGTTASSNSTASFSAPGSYVLQLAAVDGSILYSNNWVTYSLGYFDFKTYTNVIGAVTSNMTFAVGQIIGVDNTGATNVSIGVAGLRGTLANGAADVRLCWGTTDGGTNQVNWAGTRLLTNTPIGSFTANVSNLLYGVTYYYRCFASNQWSTAWAPATTNFTTLRPPSKLTNSAATGVSYASAALKATLVCTGAVYDVHASWNTVNGGTNAALWTNSAFVGAFTNVNGTNLSFTAPGLIPNTPYYFTFRAANPLETFWATNVQSFTTVSPPAPTVDNFAGATNLSAGVAVLRGTLTNWIANVSLCWGTTDGGTNGPWANTNYLAGVPSGPFGSSVSNLIYGLTYYYRCYASNQYGTAWAPSSASFTTLKPQALPDGRIPFTSMVAVSASEETAGYEVTNAFNGNGMLGDGNTHSASGEWLSSGTQPVASQWVKVRFDQTYALDYLRVWAFAESQDLCVTNADVYVLNQASDPGTNAHLSGGPFNATGWTPVLPQQIFTASPGGSITNTDPNLSLGGVLARQLAFKINATVTDLGLAGFSEIQIYRFAPPPISLTNAAANNITTTAAVLNSKLACVGAAYDVFACWNTMNAGTNTAQWTNTANVGSWSDVASTNLSYSVPGLAPGTTYYFTFRATNAVDVLWATNVLSFTTLAAGGPPVPVLPGSAISMTGGVPSFTFATVAGFKYRLVYKNALTSATWLPVIAPPNFPSPDGWSATSTGSPMSLTDTSAAGQPLRFYRLEAANP